MISTATRSRTDLSVEVVRKFPDSATESRWRKFLDTEPYAVQFSGPDFFLDPKVRGKSPFAMLISRESVVVGSLTALRTAQGVVSGLETHPQILVSEGPESLEVQRALAEALLQEGGRKYVVVYSWESLPGFEDFNHWIRPCNQTCVLDLSQDEQQLLRNVHPRKRRYVRNAGKREIIVREAVETDLPAFHEILRFAHRRLSLPEPLPLEDLLVPAVNRKLFVAIHNDRCVAGTIIRYYPGGMAEASENASLPEYWQLQPNVLLYWETIVHAKRIGCTAYNFGGHIALKREFGGAVLPIYKMSYDKTLFRWQHTRETLLTTARHVYVKLKSPAKVQPIAG